MNESNSISLLLPRSILLSVLGAGLFIPSLFQPSLDVFCDSILQSRIYRSSTFDTFWTVFNYALVETYYTIFYFRNPYSRLTVISGTKKANIQGSSRPPKPPHGMQRLQHRILEIITYIAPLLLLDLTMIKKFAGVPVEDIARSGNCDIPINGNFLQPTLHNFTIQSPL